MANNIIQLKDGNDNLLPTASINLGNITASSIKNALGTVWDLIPETQADTVYGSFSYQGRWMFIGFKYVGSQYGALLAVHYNTQYIIRILNVIGGNKYAGQITGTAL